MRLDQLYVGRYGILSDWRVGGLPAGAVVVYGPNEAGKSTLFDLLTSLLFGFAPAAAARHPYAPGDGAPLEIAADLVLQDGREIHVRRRLTSQPRGTLLRGEQAEEIANRPLPFVQHVGRDLYRALYALSVYDFRHLDGRHQDEIRDRLLGHLTSMRLRPVSAVLGELRQEAGRLWRTDRRQSRHKALADEWRGLSAEFQQALQAESGIQDRVARLSVLKSRLEHLKRERAGLQAAVRRAETLAPAARRLAQIDEWRREVGAAERLDALPVDIHGELQRLRNEIQETKTRIGDLGREMRDQQELIDAFGDAERQVLGHAAEIRKWFRLAATHDRERQELEVLRGELEARRQRVAERASDLMSAPWSAETAAALKAVPLAELKARIVRCEEDAEAVRISREARMYKEQNAPALPRPVPAWFGFAGLAAAAAAALGGWFGAVPALGGVALALAVLALGTLALGWHQKQAGAHLLGQHRQEVEALRAREREAAGWAEQSREAVARLLEGLPVTPALLERPDGGLFESVAALRAEAADLERDEQRLAEREREWEQNQQQLTALCETLGEPPGESAWPVIDRLNARLSRAEQTERNYAAACRRLEALREEKRRAAERLESLKAEHRRLEEGIRAAAGTDGAAGASLNEVVDRVVEMRRTLQLLRHHEEKLRQEYGDLDALRAEVGALAEEREEATLLDPAELELARERIEELNGGIETLAREAAMLETEIEAHRRGVSPGEISGRMAALQEKMEEVARERDRLLLMAAVLQRADREFREQHQPSVLRQAGSYLARITGGRYSGLFLLAADDGSEQLMVQPAGGAAPVPVGFPLSRGTLDQIFLAFRMAVIDHLDHGHEPLPLFLDEALVNWDDDRLENGITLLGDIADRRQVFLFTCRRALAELLGSRLDVPVTALNLNA